LSDDLNISGALGEVFAWINDCKDDAATTWAACQQVDRVLGLLDLEDQSAAGELDIDALCKALDEARANKDYGSADQLRKQMTEAGYDVQTTKEGTKAVKKLA
jgi:cysteinyl-tRNA synthetase